jgi:hypothetical protein
MGGFAEPPRARGFARAACQMAPHLRPCVKPQQPARHAPALEQDALRLSVESSFRWEIEIDVGTGSCLHRINFCLTNRTNEQFPATEPAA